MTDLKTQYQYIVFQPHNIAWNIYSNHSYNYLGCVVWHQKWKCWEFQPCDGTGWTMDCLADIQDFVKQLEKIHDYPRHHQRRARQEQGRTGL